MSDLIRSSVESNDEKIIKYQVQDNTYDDKIIRHQVMGIGGGSEPVLESLSVTANGTYTPTSGVDGFNNVDVNVPTTLPAMQLISDIRVDTDNNIIYDFVRNCTPSSSRVTINDDVMSIPVNGGINNMLGLSDYFPIKIEIDVESVEAPTTDGRGLVFVNFSPRGNSAIYLGYDNRSNYDTKSYYIYGSSGYNYPSSNINYDYFDGKTIDIYYNCEYYAGIDKWVRRRSGINPNQLRVYDHNTTNLLINNGTGLEEIPNFRIGSAGSSMVCNIKGMRTYILNELEVV